MNSSNILITGANGLLGQNLQKALSASSYLRVSADLQANPFRGLSSNTHYVKADITDRADMRVLMNETKPEVVFHAAAMTDVDGCEAQPEKAEEVNVKGTRYLVSETPPDSLFVFISTDYVFDGQNGPYSEDAQTNPLGVYGRTKWQAEEIVRERKGLSLILRTMVLYGTGLNLRPYFPDWVLGKLRAGVPFRVVDDQIGNTTLASNLAQTCVRMWENRETGTFHAAGSKQVSRFEFARAVAREFGYDPALISPCKTSEIDQKAQRPLQSGLKVDKIMQLPGIRLLDTKEQLHQYHLERGNA